MKNIKIILLIFLFATSIFASGKKVLIEVFTNSHCPLCPSAHSAVDNYASNSPNKNKITYIYYHMSFPYPDDKLNQDNTADPAARNSYYGPFGSTPRGIFDGQVQSNNYSSWSGILDSYVSQQSPFTLNLSGGTNNSGLTINAKINQTEQGTYNNLTLFVIAVETVNYQGRNGISPQKNVMRKMFPNSSGRSFTISANQEIQLSELITLNSKWDTSKLGFVVFIQNKQTKTVYQSEFISYSSLINTDVETTPETIPSKISLSQNYPNPFNPATKISFELPQDGFAELKVFDILGREVALLVREFKTSGSHTINFDGTKLSSGIYFYQLKNNSQTITKKMSLIK
ncbi:MAG: T9SS type A sorting domain-containing protein [Bacteroidota bacterium]